MTIPLILLTFSALILILVFLSDDNEFCLFLSLIGTIISFFLCILLPIDDKTKYYPVTCAETHTDKTIVVVTDYGVFNSTEKTDFDNWFNKTKGFIRCRYSSFGVETDRVFVTEIPKH